MRIDRQLLIEAIVNEVRVTNPKNVKALRIIRRKLKQAAAKGDKRTSKMLRRMSNTVLDREVVSRGGSANRMFGKWRGLPRGQVKTRHGLERARTRAAALDKSRQQEIRDLIRQQAEWDRGLDKLLKNKPDGLIIKPGWNKA